MGDCVMPRKTRKLDRANGKSIYEQIAEWILEEIKAGNFRSGEKLMSTREICELFGVNHLTVRQAIKKLGDDGVLDIIPGRGAFVANLSARQKKILLMLPNLKHGQSGEISSGVSQVLLKANCNVFLVDYHDQMTVEQEYLRRIKDDGYDGAIIYPSMQAENVAIMLQLMMSGFPVVVLDREMKDVPGSYVLSDNYAGGYLAGSHLVGKGCQRIGCITTSLWSAERRLDGFCAALAENGVRVRRELIKEVGPEGDVNHRATAELLALPDRPDGIFYYNDFQALIGYKQIKSAGLCVGEDIQVVGFDDISVAELLDPPLTTVKQNSEEVGRRAADLLIEQIELGPGASHPHMKEITVPVELVIRASA